MKKNTVLIDGEKYPCALTLGAMKAFREETGKEVSEIDKATDSDKIDLTMMLVFCCIQSASRRDKVVLPFSSVDEMLDFITPDELPDVVASVFTSQDTDAQIPDPAKKKRPKSMS
ncbi:hypothetical protein [Massilibacteroides sp.]|jgi:hypothetical protein|uniref:hypothetical protein n=1 Tax=Massilibacteroides sp. TaxID=2034766 RepID=UPI0026183717|nr:hypothetical protein [Massilibacteroides sp.]MDD4516469.1 hypothetical protein [Massilibacteroides sp.]